MQPEDEKKIKELLESLEKQNIKQFKIGFLLNKNFGMHLLLMFIINTLSFMAVIGFGLLIKFEALTYTIESFLIFCALFTLIEVFIKLFIYKFLMKLIVMTLGLINFFITTFLIFGVIYFIPNISFIKPNEIVNLAIFSLFFTILRFIIIQQIRKYQFKKMMGV